VTTVVATVGTEPFAIYHFHHLVLYSPLANVIAVPISAMWTLPWGVVACLLMPFGLEALALTPMGWSIDVTIAVAQWVQSLPGNVWSMPRLPTFGVILVALGGCWLCLWQQRWRYWGIAGIAAGMAMMLLTRPPDLVLADFGHFLAARTPEGDYRVAAGAEKIHRSFLVSETGARLLPWRAIAALARSRRSRRRRARLRGRRPLQLHRLWPARRDRHSRERVADVVRHGRCDCRAGACRVRLPRQDPDRRPHRHLAPGRRRVVARCGWNRRRRRE
jgi:hypothetical protein